METSYNHHVTAIFEGIEKTLAEEEVKLAILKEQSAGEHQDKLDALRDFERLAWMRVADEQLTPWEAEEAIDAFINWIEFGDSGLKT